MGDVIENDDKRGGEKKKKTWKIKDKTGGGTDRLTDRLMDGGKGHILNYIQLCDPDIGKALASNKYWGEKSSCTFYI